MLEIVYVSFDHNREEFEQAKQLMPWICIDFGDERIQTICANYKITGIPHLIILTPDGNTLIQNARMDVQAKGFNVFDEWLTRANKGVQQKE